MIQYDFYKTPAPDGEETDDYHVRAVGGQTCTTQQVAEQIEKSTSLTTADIKAALAALSDIMLREMENGNSVQLDNVGTFRPIIKGKVEKRKNSLKMVEGEVRTVAFKPDSKMMKSLKLVSLSKAENKGNHSEKTTMEKVRQELNTYFETSSFITTAQILTLTHQTRSTAARIIKKLEADGFITNKGSRQRAIYVKGK